MALEQGSVITDKGGFKRWISRTPSEAIRHVEESRPHIYLSKILFSLCEELQIPIDSQQFHYTRPITS